MAPDGNGSTADSGTPTLISGGNQTNHLVIPNAELQPSDRGGGKDAGKSGRDYKRTNWTVEECMVLQAAKREDYIRQRNDGAKEKHKSAAERWQAVEDFCWMHNVHRSSQQCKDRWEKMSADFKKIDDYERQAASGQTRYWHMNLEQKKAKRLPSKFYQEVYIGLSQWFNRGRGADAANGIQENLGSLCKDSEASAKVGSNGLQLTSDEAESDTPPAEPPFESGSDKRRSDEFTTEVLFESGSDKRRSDGSTAEPLLESGSDKRRSDGDLSSEDPDGLGMGVGIANGRDYRRTNWSLAESLVLQAAKRENSERQYNRGHKEKQMSAAERWQAVEDYCWSNGVHRSGQQCRDRWDKLSADFKKISDYEKQNVIGQRSYWLMTPEEKKAKRLPTVFWEEVFAAMNEWFGKTRNIDLRVVIHDSSLPDQQLEDEGFQGTDEDEQGSEPDSVPERVPVRELSFDKERRADGEVPVIAEEGRAQRDYRKTNWTLQESMVLQAAKLDDAERQAKDKNRKAADRWQTVEDFCFSHNVRRSGQQCKDRWEKMSVDFKKVYNYQKQVTDEASSYWNLTGEERKSRRLPLTFFQEVFVAMSQWFTKDRLGGSYDLFHDSEAQQQDSRIAGTNEEELCGSDRANSESESDLFIDSRSRKRRRAALRTDESLAEIMERSNHATQRILLECEDRKDRRLERTLEANGRRLEKTLEANERIAISYCQAFISLADAIRSIAASANPQV
ncbi:hypothetical protein R1sor_002271 [Riccia sorocarpa]|uniref:Myb-like domain-containing protein n=1 Tax=Riccia sorocarpa TaxID=122646 RepID=A0ABD3H2B2_9MARC